MSIAVSITVSEEPDFVECPNCAEYMIPKVLPADFQDYFIGCPGYRCPNCNHSESYLPFIDPIILLTKDYLLKEAEKKRQKRLKRNNY